MNRRSWHVVCGIVALVVTYCVHWLDLSLVGKIAPAIAGNFGVPLESMTRVFTIGRIGMALGAILGGLAGDRWGRKPVLCACLGLAAILSLLTPLLNNLNLFAIVRGASGLLLGGAAPCALALVASIAPERWRAMALTTTLAGASLGSALGSSLVYVVMTRSNDWQLTFWISGIALLAALVLVGGGVSGVRTPVLAQAHGAIRGLFGPMRTTTWLLGIGFLLSMGLNALLASWLPSFFHALAGVPIERFARVAMLTTPAAIVGMLATGWLSQRMSKRLLLVLCFGGNGLSLALLGTLGFASAGFVITLAILSCTQAACQALLNLTVVSRYPVALRATAFGGAAAMGRAGGIFAPTIGALALEAQFPIQPLFILFAAVPLIVGLLLWAIEMPEPSKEGYRSPI